MATIFSRPYLSIGFLLISDMNTKYYIYLLREGGVEEKQKRKQQK
jgi:hypothetical protein